MFLCALLIIIPLASLISAIGEAYWYQGYYIFWSVVTRVWLHYHLKTYQTTRSLLQARQKFMDMANQL